jgi:hypothetical protein
VELYTAFLPMTVVLGASRALSLSTTTTLAILAASARAEDIKVMVQFRRSVTAVLVY